jgi:hypothetical protein
LDALVILVWLLTWILNDLGVEPAMLLWQWFGENWFITLLMLIFLA